MINNTFALDSELINNYYPIKDGGDLRQDPQPLVKSENPFLDNSEMNESVFEDLPKLESMINSDEDYYFNIYLLFRNILQTPGINDIRFTYNIPLHHQHVFYESLQGQIDSNQGNLKCRYTFGVEVNDPFNLLSIYQNVLLIPNVTDICIKYNIPIDVVEIVQQQTLSQNAIGSSSEMPIEFEDSNNKEAEPLNQELPATNEIPSQIESPVKAPKVLKFSMVDKKGKKISQKKNPYSEKIERILTKVSLLSNETKNLHSLWDLKNISKLSAVSIEHFEFMTLRRNQTITNNTYYTSSQFYIYVLFEETMMKQPDTWNLSISGKAIPENEDTGIPLILREHIPAHMNKSKYIDSKSFICRRVFFPNQAKINSFLDGYGGVHKKHRPKYTLEFTIANHVDNLVKISSVPLSFFARKPKVK